MKILTRYVVREHIGPLVFALAALTSLLMLQYVARQLGNLVGKGLSWRVIAEFFVLSLPFTIAMTMPMAVLVSTLYAFGRMASENEITAFKASGIRVRALMTPVLVCALLVSLGMIAFNDQVLPAANHRLRLLQQDMARTKPTLALNEQVLNVIKPEFIIRVSRLDNATSRLYDVVIYDLSHGQERKTIYADSGYMTLTPNKEDLQLFLYDGYSQEFPKGDARRLQRTYFSSQVVRVDAIASTFKETGSDGWKGNREMSICEMQRDYVVAAREFERLRNDYIESARKLAKPGQRVTAPRPRPAAEPLARLYCNALALVFRTQTATPNAPPPVKPPQPIVASRQPLAATGAVASAVDSAHLPVMGAAGRGAGPQPYVASPQVGANGASAQTVQPPAAVPNAASPNPAGTPAPKANAALPQSSTEAIIMPNGVRIPSQQEMEIAAKGGMDTTAYRISLMRLANAGGQTNAAAPPAGNPPVGNPPAGNSPVANPPATNPPAAAQSNAVVNTAANAAAIAAGQLAQTPAMIAVQSAAAAAAQQGSPQGTSTPSNPQPQTVTQQVPAAPAQLAVPDPKVAHEDSLIEIRSTLQSTRFSIDEQRSTIDNLAVEIQKKFALSIACFVFVLFGPPIALRFPRGGVGVTLGVSIVAFGLYYICLMAGETLADDGKLPAWVAMWAANLIFTIGGVILLLRIEKTADRSRSGGIADWFEERKAKRALKQANSVRDLKTARV